MPIYEFKCLRCNDLFELLVMGDSDQAEMHCPKCKSEDFERVMSTSNFSISGGGSTASKGGASAQTRTCPSGSCTTYDIPGPTR